MGVLKRRMRELRGSGEADHDDDDGENGELKKPSRGQIEFKGIT